MSSRLITFPTFPSTKSGIHHVLAHYRFILPSSTSVCHPVFLITMMTYLLPCSLKETERVFITRRFFAGILVQVFHFRHMCCYEGHIPLQHHLLTSSLHHCSPTGHQLYKGPSRTVSISTMSLFRINRYLFTPMKSVLN